MMTTCLVPHLRRKPDARRRPTALAPSAAAEEREWSERDVSAEGAARDLGPSGSAPMLAASLAALAYSAPLNETAKKVPILFLTEAG